MKELMERSFVNIGGDKDDEAVMPKVIQN